MNEGTRGTNARRLDKYVGSLGIKIAEFTAVTVDGRRVVIVERGKQRNESVPQTDNK